MARKCVAALLVLTGVYTFPALAITSKEVMSKMSEDERFGYLTGLIDMLAYHAGMAGNTARVKCIVDAYYRDPKPTSAAWSKLYKALDRFHDKQPATVVALLAEQACGK